MTKTAIKAAYLANLQRIYAGKVDYSERSRPYTLASQAADKALAGSIKLEGEAWNEALRAAADSLAGKGDSSFAFIQRAVALQTGECVPLLA